MQLFYACKLHMHLYAERVFTLLIGAFTAVCLPSLAFVFITTLSQLLKRFSCDRCKVFFALVLQWQFKVHVSMNTLIWCSQSGHTWRYLTAPKGKYWKEKNRIMHAGRTSQPPVWILMVFIYGWATVAFCGCIICLLCLHYKTVRNILIYGNKFNL